MMTIEELYRDIIDGLVTKRYYTCYDWSRYVIEGRKFKMYQPRGCTFRIDTYTDNYNREWRCESHHKFTVPKYRYRQGLITI